MVSRGVGTGRRAVGRPSGGEDLRAALVAAALRLLEHSADPAAVTVAAIVEEVGCTPPTLYHYWPKRELLLREASAEGFAAFRRSQEAAAAGVADPLDRIRSRGKAYVEFAMARPSLFRVLFLDRRLPGRQPAHAEDPGQGLADVVEDVSHAMTGGQLAHGDPLLVALGLWAAVHGLAALWVVSPELPRELMTAVVERQTDALLKGYASSDR